MNGHNFEDPLIDYLDGKLGIEEQGVVEMHLKSCERCRQLLTILRGNLDILTPESSEDLARSILDRTSGSTCGRVQELLPELVSENLGSEDAYLVCAHLEHCSGCQALAATLRELAVELPAMAEVLPDSDFADSVLSVTRWSRRGPVARPVIRDPWWKLFLERPRFAWEAAYVGTLLLTFVLWNPWLPLYQPAAEKLASAQIQYERTRDALFRLAPSLLPDAGSGYLQNIWQDAGKFLDQRPILEQQWQALQERKNRLIQAADGFVTETARGFSSKTYEVIQQMSKELREGKSRRQSWKNDRWNAESSGRL
jgi:hypothetical protein